MMVAVVGYSFLHSVPLQPRPYNRIIFADRILQETSSMTCRPIDWLFRLGLLKAFRCKQRGPKFVDESDPMGFEMLPNACRMRYNFKVMVKLHVKVNLDHASCRSMKIEDYILVYWEWPEANSSDAESLNSWAGLWGN